MVWLLKNTLFLAFGNVSLHNVFKLSTFCLLLNSYWICFILKHIYDLQNMLFLKLIEIVTLAKNSNLIIIDPSSQFNYGLKLLMKTFISKLIWMKWKKSRKTDKVNKIEWEIWLSNYLLKFGLINEF